MGRNYELLRGLLAVGLVLTFLQEFQPIRPGILVNLTRYQKAIVMAAEYLDKLFRLIRHLRGQKTDRRAGAGYRISCRGTHHNTAIEAYQIKDDAAAKELRYNLVKVVRNIAPYPLPPVKLDVTE